MMGWRKIRLLSPSVSKIIDWVVWNDQKLDFKSIAAAFGLEPSTVKLNSHFISRDTDLLASCVTWQSLLAFFSAKGLSSGKDVAGALLVDGKLPKVGTKIGEPLLSRCNKRKLLSEEDMHSLKKLKLNMGDSFGKISEDNGVSKTPLKCSFTSDGLKRTREDDMIAYASCKKTK